MKSNRIVFATLLTLIASNAALARGKVGGFGLDIEPIIGYERVQKLVPEAHYRQRLIYGGRVSAGVPLLALEAEYTQSRDVESFTSQDLVTTDKTQKAKAGLRSTMRMASFLSFIARGGVQAVQNNHTETTGGVVTDTETEAITYDPYAGAGFKIHLSHMLTFSADVVAIFNEWPNMNKNDYQTTAGFSIRFP